jgi:single-strand selective monofunctional uracil DNA glycosylase
VNPAAAGGVAELLAGARRLADEVAGLRFGPPVTHVYNPLEYAWGNHEAYLRRYGEPTKEVVLVGMNPGPWGMAQTGVPFGEVTLVREWLGIDGRVGRPQREHPSRPVEGLSCRRHEVSGRRLWGWARDRFVTPERFFARFIVLNYCPLLFLEESARNRTPDRLPREERAPLLECCDRALREAVGVLSPRLVVGIGRFARERAARALRGTAVRVGEALHPSPASPAANRSWAVTFSEQLGGLGITLG